jgi:hypothetical protein
MIPQRFPRRVVGENGVRYRVAACRQRLRNSRTTHRAINQSQMDKDSREPGLPASNYFDEAAGFLSSGVATDVVFDARAAESRVTLALMEAEEKVGIT